MRADLFQNPPKEYREVPFWSWNDDLDPAELRRQIALMDEAGWGGFFMHSRVGLRTPYLGKRWMELIRTCVDEARQRGMGAWLYDEDKWPSGFAGGLAVTKPEYRAQGLVCLVDNKPALVEEAIAAFVSEQRSGLLEDFQLLTDLAAFDGDRQSLVQFYALRSSLGVPWFNGYTYVNALNPAAVREFIHTTHAAYASAVGDAFGRAIPGIFTDEPAYLSANTPGIGVVEPGEVQMVPWVDDLPALFQERWGYDLLPHLPELFFDIPGYPRTRCHFWRLVTEQFVNNFTRQIYDWCEGNNLALTGHYLLEDSLWFQVRWNGACMPHYEYEHVPGIDKLARNLFTVLTVKQLDSAACQLGKKRALCESYGAVGQDFSFAGRKWIGDWLYVLGINFNNPHLSLYSMRGERKRDHPANLYYQQPWWGENRLAADYMARLSYALSQGQRVVEVLVLHPIGSAWSRYRPDSLGALAFLDESLRTLEQTLLGAQRDFHYGDEMLMEKYARVVLGNDGTPRLEIGKMAYAVVVVPPSYTWSTKTVALMAEFSAAGGVILAVLPLPGEIDGVISPAAGIFSQARVTALDELPVVLDEVLPFDVRVTGRSEIWYHHRREGNSDWYFLCNTSLESKGQSVVELRGSGRLEEWNLVKGGSDPLIAMPGDAGNSLRITLDFPPDSSHLLVLQRDQKPNSVPASLPVPAQRREISLAKRWTLTLLEPNAITLDRAAVKVAAGEWSSPLDILDVHRRAAAGGAGTPFSLRYTLQVDEPPLTGDLFLAIENPERYTLALNGQPVANQEHGWWRDISFRKVDISRVGLRKGTNIIELSGVFTRDTEIESIYLVGFFGVSVSGGIYEGGSSGQSFYRYGQEFRVTTLPGEVSDGDLVPQGLPFFAGRVRLAQTFDLPHTEAACSASTLVMDTFTAALAKVSLNGKEMGSIAWQPYAVALGNSLQPGQNRVEIELVSTLRNLLGPHHQRGGDAEGVGPASFRSNPLWIDDYTFAPFGLGGVKIGTVAT